MSIETKPHYVVIREYDENNNIVVQITHHKDTGNCTRYEYEYDENDNLIKELYYLEPSEGREKYYGDEH